MPQIHVFAEMVSVGYLRDQPSQGKGGFWTVEYYQSYFDVDTHTVRPSSGSFLTLSTQRVWIFRFSSDALQRFSQRHQIIYRRT
jgi:hypothetical protein